VRYFGIAGYSALELDWFGQGDRFGGRSVSYSNDVAFTRQQLQFRIGRSPVRIGPVFRFLDAEARFAPTGLPIAVPPLEIASRTSGLGVELSYDTRDQPFAPRTGVFGSVSYTYQSEALGGDFDYGDFNSFGIGYVPLSDAFVLGLRVDLKAVGEEAPFYDLPAIEMRGIQRGRFVDDYAGHVEAELRWDVSRRWTLLAYGGLGRVAGSFSDLWDASDEFAIGTGFRYLIAEDYGIPLGLDLAWSDDDWTFYVTVGTGWMRP